MLTLVLAAVALAADPAGTTSGTTTTTNTTTTNTTTTAPQTFATGQNANTVFAQTTLTKVGNIKSGNVSYELRCATLNNTKTCSAYDNTGKVVATSTSVSTTPTNGFTATFPDTFTTKSVTYEVKQ
jgi:hypothetical protein